jgi:PAS domain S-box-containing protein
MNNNVIFNVSDLNLLPIAIGLVDASGLLSFTNRAFDQLCAARASGWDRPFEESLFPGERLAFRGALAAILAGQSVIRLEASLLEPTSARATGKAGAQSALVALTLLRNPEPIFGCDCLLMMQSLETIPDVTLSPAAAAGSAATQRAPDVQPADRSQPGQRRRSDQSDGLSLAMQLRAVVDNLPEPVWLKGVDRRFVLVNRQFEDVYGLPQSEILGRTAAEILGEDVAALAEAEDARAIAAGLPVVYPTFLERDGGRRYYEVTKIAIRAPSGEFVGILGYALDVTATKQREDVLAAAIREQQLVFEHTSVGIVFVRQSVIARVNDAFGQIFGYSQDELLGATVASLPMFQVAWPQWQAPADAATPSVPGASPTIVTEQVFVRRDGQRVTCSIYARALNEDDQSQGMVYALIDVSAQRESERKLAETRALLDAVIEHLPSVVSVRDAESGRYVHFSRSAEKMVGRQREDILGHTPFEVYPPEDADEVESVARLVIQTGQRFSTTTSIVNQLTGKTGFAQRTTIPIVDEAGKVRYVMNLGEDITEKISSDRALRESEARFRQFASNVDQALFWSDPDRSSWHFQNAVFEEIWGVSRQQLALQPDVPMQAILEADRDIFRQAQQLEKLLQRVDVEFRVENPIRGVRWVRMRTVSSRAEGGAVRVFGTMDDITERKQHEQERIERLVQQRDKLVKEVHHRIKNNLQGVVGLLQHSARTKPGLAEELKEIAGQISAIAQVHGLQTGESADIGVVDLVKAVVLALSRAIGREFKTEIAASLTDWALQESEGVACALVINELAANAVAHAKGDAGLRLFADGADALVVEVWNGGELPESFEPAGAKTKASGIGLMRALVPRKGGDLKFTQADSIVTATLRLSPPAIYRRDEDSADWG